MVCVIHAAIHDISTVNLDVLFVETVHLDTKTFGCSDSRGTMDTLDEFVDEWARFLDRAMKSEHIYARLHRQIINDYKKDRQLRIQNKKKRLKEKAKQNQKIERAKDREKAVCKICGKDTFNSTKQLTIHMKKKHNKI